MFQLGSWHLVVVLRDFGPYLHKPDLPAGEYRAQLFGISTSTREPQDWLIEHNGQHYNIPHKFVKVA